MCMYVCLYIYIVVGLYVYIFIHFLHYRHSVLVAVACNAQGGIPLRSLMVRPSIAMIRVLPIASSLQFLC